MRFKRLLLNPDFFKEGKSLPSDQKASWLNDVELIGFQMGVLPNIRGDYIDTLWAKDNEWMERQHNYVQWVVSKRDGWYGGWDFSASFLKVNGAYFAK